MSADKKEYQQVVIILKEQSTPSAKHNKLLKIFVTTEDLSLRERLDLVIKGYSAYVQPRACRSKHIEGLPDNYSEWIPFIRELIKPLIDYCEDILENVKPQWQIVAERNGWKPGSVLEYRGRGHE
jgi:hypothetical protein